MRRSVRREIGAALWLQSRDLVHFGRRRLVGRFLIAGYVVVCGLLVAGGLAAYAHHGDVPLGAIFTPIWLLWALLPAVGAGGGSLDATSSIAPYPTGPAMLLASSWFSALTDVQYLLPVPVLLAGSAADYGLSGLLGSFAFVAGASALGQLAGWFSVAGLRARRGQSLAVTAAAVAVLAAVTVARRSRPAEERHLGTIPPTRWLLSGARAAQHGQWTVAAGWYALLVSPIVVLLVLGPAVVRRATIARLAGPSSAPHRAGFRPTPTGALAGAAWRGVVRSRAWRATLLAVVAVPFMTVLLTQPLSYRSLVTVAVISAGATIAANTWAFEGGGVTVLLTAPVGRGTVVVVRTVVLTAALAMSLGVATAAAIVAGPLRASPSDLGYAACVLLLVAVAGMRTSTSTASASDVDSLRARPATLPAVLGFGGRCLLGSLLLSAVWHFGVLGAIIGTLGVLGYAAWAFRGTRRRSADGATLLAAFATIR
ncbi:MAG: hypothetical protein ABR571_08420 [Jatrophihabitans sp.]|uniref:hypothetical protein n=1 Tax=Jatrophihabitans sp. TaxID=1932789 RepID=UPI00390E9333